MASIYNYTISVSFHKGQCSTPIGALDVPYQRNQANVRNDKAVFFKKKFVIMAKRKKFYLFDAIMNNSNLSLHQEIERCLLVYYANSTNFARINNIRITVTRPSGILEYDLKTDKNRTPQLFNEHVQRNMSHSFMPSSDYLALDEKGKALRISLSYWLEATNSKAKQIKFERSWTAFNTLYTYYGKCSQEINNHIYIRGQIKANEAQFPLTVNGVKYLNITTLRNYRWEVWLVDKLKNKFGTVEPVICGLHDTRLKTIFSRLFSRNNVRAFFTSPDPVKQTELQTKLTNITTSLSAAGTVNDLELAFFICINYAYFLRNRRFHGGSINTFCKLSPTTEELEYDKVSEKLMLLVKEMYVAHNNLVVNPNP